MTDAFKLFRTNDRNASAKRKTLFACDAARHWLLIYVSHVFLYCVKRSIVPFEACFRLCLWGAVRKNIISDRFSTKTAISAHI